MMLRSVIKTLVELLVIACCFSYGLALHNRNTGERNSTELFLHPKESSPRLLSTTKTDSLLSLDTFLKDADLSRVLQSSEFKDILDIVKDEGRDVFLPVSSTNNTREITLAFLRLNFMSVIRRVLVRKPASVWFPQPDDVGDVCYGHMMTYFENLIGKGDNSSDLQDVPHWALNMFDATGKPNSGVLAGRLQFIGNYDGCQGVRATTSPRTSPGHAGAGWSRRHLFSGRYCRVRMPLRQSMHLPLPEDVNTFWLDNGQISVNVNWGVCVPDTCSERDLAAFLTGGTLSVFNMPVEDVTCLDKPGLQGDAGAIFVIVLVLIVATIVTLCTVLDLYRRGKAASGSTFWWWADASSNKKEKRRGEAVKNTSSNKVIQEACTKEEDVENGAGGVRLEINEQNNDVVDREEGEGEGEGECERESRGGRGGREGVVTQVADNGEQSKTGSKPVSNGCAVVGVSQLKETGAKSTPESNNKDCTETDVANGKVKLIDEDYTAADGIVNEAFEMCDLISGTPTTKKQDKAEEDGNLKQEEDAKSNAETNEPNNDSKEKKAADMEQDSELTKDRDLENQGDKRGEEKAEEDREEGTIEESSEETTVETKELEEKARKVGQRQRGARKSTSLCDHLIKGLSIYTNFLQLMNTNLSSSKPTIKCLEGLKAITMTWVVLGHTYTFGGIIDEGNILFDNALEMINIPHRLAFHIVGSAQFGVDTFFVICGCLVMFIALDKLQYARQKWSFWACFIFHRFWRLTPIYMVVLAIGTTLYRHIVQGPLKSYQLEEFHECRQKWWAHLLYINNFYSPKQKCMTWSWYLAVDMQFHVLSPLFIYPVFRNRRLGAGLIVCLLLVGMVSAVISELLYGGQFLLMDMCFLDYWSYVYTMPWVRVGAFAIGLLLGVLLRHPDKGEHFLNVLLKRKWPGRLFTPVMWILSLGVGVGLALITHAQWKHGTGHWGRPALAAFECLSRPLWSLAVAWVIFACNTGRAGPVAKVLSWAPFIVLSRLSYLVYLLHPLVILFVVHGRRTAIVLHPNRVDQVYNYLGNLILTHLFAVALYLLVEAPVRNLEVFWDPRARREKKEAPSSLEEQEDAPL